MRLRRAFLLCLPFVVGLPVVVLYRTIGPVRIHLPAQGKNILHAMAYETKRHPYAVRISVQRDSVCRNYAKPHQLEPAFEELVYTRRETLWPHAKKETPPNESWFGRNDKILHYYFGSKSRKVSCGGGWSKGRVDDHAIQLAAKRDTARFKQHLMREKLEFPNYVVGLGSLAE